MKPAIGASVLARPETASEAMGPSAQFSVVPSRVVYEPEPPAPSSGLDWPGLPRSTSASARECTNCCNRVDAQAQLPLSLSITDRHIRNDHHFPLDLCYAQEGR